MIVSLDLLVHSRGVAATGWEGERGRGAGWIGEGSWEGKGEGQRGGKDGRRGDVRERVKGSI